ncbi:MAG: FAD-dependent oxidoreductase, partial [Bdellovibrionota bacterium]
MLNRRDFLARLSAISAGALLPLPTFAHGNPHPVKDSSNRKVLVAGAGIAGLYAADLLRARGFDVQIVEASDRTGGKLMGGTVAGFAFDFGGQGFSSEMKRVQDLGKRLGLTRITRPSPDDFFLDGDTLRVSPEYNAIRAERLAFDEKASDLYPHLADPGKRAEYAAMSVMDFARNKFTASGLAYFRTNFSSEWCSLPDNVSFLHFLEIQNAFEGDEANEMSYRYREGFIALADRLTQRLASRIRLKAPLESVQVNDHGISAVAGGQTYQAHALVLAVPLPLVSKIQFSGFDTHPLLDSLSSYRGCSVRKILAVYAKPF